MDLTLPWHVYNACHTLVATYSTEGGAASHVASWPALYYSHIVTPPSPTDVSSDDTTLTLSPTERKSHGRRSNDR